VIEFWPSGLAMRLVIGFAIAAAICIVALRVRALSASGAWAALGVGAAVYGFGGLAVAAPLIAFFVTGSALSRIRSAGAQRARALATKGSTRDAVQVLANGAVPALCCIASAFASGVEHSTLVAAAVGAICAAAADTWSTEVGALSKEQTRSIVDFRAVPPGTSGGVTALGFIASLAGGALVGALAAPFIAGALPMRWIAWGAIVGFFGAALDSVLGATLQGMWHCPQCDETCESRVHRCGARTSLVRGLRAIDNDAVNFIANVAGAIAGGIGAGALR
jgi:uncharacterized protein (TIGR00297 family)